MTNVEKAMRFARKVRAKEWHEYSIAAYRRHLLTLAKEFERIQCAALEAELETIPVTEQTP